MYVLMGDTHWFASEKKVIGIDPGKNFGVSIQGGTEKIIFNGVLNDDVFPLRDMAFHFAQVLYDTWKPTEAIIEGASYGDRFGQVKLAEVRCGFALGLSEKGIPVTIVAPKSARKIVFGNGDTCAMDTWVTINHNAADALCLSLVPHYQGDINDRKPTAQTVD